MGKSDSRTDQCTFKLSWSFGVSIVSSILALVSTHLNPEEQSSILVEHESSQTKDFSPFSPHPSVSYDSVKLLLEHGSITTFDSSVVKSIEVILHSCHCSSNVAAQTAQRPEFLIEQRRSTEQISLL
jgi:hypothetical protein